MAFEDRCSPQSAPSPPGIAQSPQKTGIVLTTNGNDSHNSSYTNSYTIEQEMSMMIPANAATAAAAATTTTTPIEKPTTPITANDVECSTSPSLQQQNGITIKQEKSTSPQQHTAPISFSITNILSNNFGHNKLATNCNQVNHKAVISEKKSSGLFRPYDDDDRENGVTSPKKTKLSTQSNQSDYEDDDESVKRMESKSVTDQTEEEIDEEIDVTDERTKFHQNSAIDFSNGRQFYNLSPAVKDFYNQERLIQANAQSAQHQQQKQSLLHHYQAAAAVAAAQQSLHRVGAHGLIDGSSLEAHHRSLLYPDFYHQTQQQQQAALAKSIYPKLHEDILNSSKQYQQYYQTTRLLTDSVLAKYPPLGNLCKTVSQIGQTPAPIVHPPTDAKSATSPVRSAESKSKALKRSASHLENVSNCASNDAISVTVSTSSSSSSSTVSNELPTAKSSANQSHSLDSGMESSDDTKSETGSKDGGENGSQLWPAWIYCTRYSDRPSSGPRYRKPKQPKVKGENDEKRPRTAFSMEQLARLKREFNENRYLTERRRQQLSSELGLNEAQIKIWFQNKRAKIKKSSGQKNPLAMQLMAQGLYNHSTVPLTKEEEELEMRMNGQL